MISAYAFCGFIAALIAVLVLISHSDDERKLPFRDAVTATFIIGLLGPIFLVALIVAVITHGTHSRGP